MSLCNRSRFTARLAPKRLTDTYRPNKFPVQPRVLSMTTNFEIPALATTVTVVAGCLTSPAFSQIGFEDKQCIFAAAQKLPAIPGLQIIESRAVRTPQKGKREGFEFKIEIDVKAAGQPATFAFVCSTDGAKGIFVISLGMSR